MHGMSTIFGCIILATYTHQQVTVTITGGPFQKLNTDVSGNCDTNGVAKDLGELYGTNKTYDCRQTPQRVTNLTVYGAEVSKEVGSVQFDQLVSDEIKVVNIWCGAPIANAANCEPVIFYEIKVTNTSDGYDCELRFAADLLSSKDYGSDFKRPSEVQWKVNGNSLSPAVSKSLGASDFADEQPDDIKSIKYPLQIEAEKKVGTFSCEFTVPGSSETIKSEIGVSAEPVGVSWRTEPEKEQFSDKEDVKISCAFTGSPTPTITWTHEGEAFAGEANITSKGNQIISTITIMDLEDSKDRGTYSCLAKNTNGETTIEGILHVRDKLAPLWPFIGIVVQVIALAICIYIGEKIRKKKHAEKQRKRQRQTEGLSDDTSATRT